MRNLNIPPLNFIQIILIVESITKTLFFLRHPKISYLKFKHKTVNSTQRYWILFKRIFKTRIKIMLNYSIT